MKTNWVEKLFLNNFVWAFTQRHLIIPIWSESLELGAEDVVLEIGCGRGAGSVMILEEYGPGRVDALDLDEEMLVKAREFIPKAYGDRIHLMLGDVKNINAADNSYDAVFDFFTLVHVEDWEAGLREVARVLKPGGFFAFGELYGSTLNSYFVRTLFGRPQAPFFERQEWVRALAESGLRMMEKNRKLWGKGIIGVAKKA